jgi:hypothetical protein
VSDPTGLVGKALVGALYSEPDDAARIAWEGRSISSHSPGPVQPAEFVVHTLDQPKHVEEDGVTLTASAFSGMDSLGLSVARESFCSREEIIVHAYERVRIALERAAAAGAPPQDEAARRRPFALVRFEVAELRSVVSDETGNRVMGVYDSGLPGGPVDRAHADVVAFKGKAAERKARRWMQREAHSRMRPI